MRSSRARSCITSNNVVRGNVVSSGEFINTNLVDGHSIRDQMYGKVRKLVETCDSFEGFLVHGSVCGSMGTFQGEMLRTYFDKVELNYISHFPDE